jgi:hypothetical protein
MLLTIQKKDGFFYSCRTQKKFVTIEQLNDYIFKISYKDFLLKPYILLACRLTRRAESFNY